MKRLIIVLSLFIVPLIGSAQIYKQLPDFYQPIDSATLAQNKQADDKTDFGVTLGTGFSSMSGNSLMRSYVAPHFKYRFSEDLQVSFTGVFANSNNELFSSTPAPGGQNSGIDSYGFSGSTLYKANENLTIRARASYMENSMQPFNLYPQNQKIKTDYKSLSFGMDYKIGENSRIGVQFNFSDGYNPYYSPYQNQLYQPQNPFHSANPLIW
ncbi:MAG: hypothetical protein ACLFUW_08275 [Bacteroidales bacterium]